MAPRPAKPWLDSFDVAPTRSATGRLGGLVSTPGRAAVVSLVLIALLMLAAGLSIRSSLNRLNEVRDQRDRVDHAYQVLLATESVLSIMKDAETGQRGFILTGDDAYLNPYDAALDRIHPEIARLSSLAGDRPDQSQRLADARGLIDAKLDELASTIKARREQGPDAAARIVASGRGKSVMDGLRAVMAAINQEERNRLDEHTAAVPGMVRSLRVEIAARTALLVVLLAGAWSLMIALARRREEVARSRNTLATTLASIGDAVATTDIDGRVTYLNPVAESLTGWTNAEARGRPLVEVFRIVNEQTRQNVANPVERALREGTIVGLANHTILIAKDGAERPIDDSAAPIRTPDGRITGCVLVFRDVTEAKLARERERELLAAAVSSNARFRAFFDQGALFAGIMHTDGTILEPNRLALEACGYTRAQVVGKPFWECPWWSPSPALAEQVRAASERAAAGETFRGEMPYFVADGSQRMVDLSILPIKDAAGRVLFLAPTGTDITDRKRAEDDRRRFFALAESSTDFIGMCDLEGVPFYVNPAAMSLVGLDSLEQARRTPVQDFFFPEDQGWIMAEFFPSVLKAGHAETEIRFRHFKTGAAIWMIYRVFIVTDAQGRGIAFATISQDITRRRAMESELSAHRQHLELLVTERTAELVEAHERLRVADRMAAVGTLAAGLAHDMRNVLMPLGVRLDAVMSSPGLSEEARSDLASVTRLLEHLREMSRNLSLFARDPEQEGTIGRTELANWCEAVKGFIDSSTAGSRGDPARGVQIRWDIPDGLPPVAVSPHRITQAVLNLAHNARDAILAARHAGTPAADGSRGCITISARPAPDNGAVVIEVTDDGCGMDEATKRRCTEAFFTTKNRASAPGLGGSGLGLALVYTITERAGGRMEIDSTPGKGTRVSLFLPIAREQPEAQPPAGRAVVTIEHTRTRALILEVLRALRYEPRDGLPDADATLWITDGSAADPQQAADFLREKPDRRVVAVGGDDRWRAAGAVVCEPTTPISKLRDLLAGHPGAPGK